MQQESYTTPSLRPKLLHVSFVLARKKCQWHDTTHVHLRAIYMHIQLQLGADCLDVLEAFLVIGPRATNPDLYLVLDEGARNFTERPNDTFEC